MIPVRKSRERMVEISLKEPTIPPHIFEKRLSSFWSSISFSRTHPSGPEAKSTYQKRSPLAYSGPLVITPLAPSACIPIDGPPGELLTSVSPLDLTPEPTGVSPGSNTPPFPLRKTLSGTHPSGPEAKSTNQYRSPLKTSGPPATTPLAPFCCVPSEGPPGNEKISESVDKEISPPIGVLIS